MSDAQSHIPLFSVSDILDAIEQFNFKKAIGEDGFDGRILSIFPEVRAKVAQWITDGLNSESLPDYLRDGRMVPLSKRKDIDVVSLDDIRPIVIKSHIAKICEKALLAKIKLNSGYLLEIPKYQAGFK